MTSFRAKTIWLPAALLAVALANPILAQQRFASAEAAAQALIDAAGHHDQATLAAIFGPQGNSILSSGNPEQDKAEQAEFARLAHSKNRLHQDRRDRNREILAIGDEDWPFPVPIVRKDGKWSFDPSEARTEMQARRIGAHELDAIEICAGYVEAQRKYATEARDKDGLMHYANHISGAPGREDGLYLAGRAASFVPQGLADAAWAERRGNAKPYHGYYFKILDGQGPHAPGGAHNYLVKNKLLGGFGLVAWPAQYGVTGIETFIVNQEGIVYEKDIPPPPAGKPIPISVYDPDPSWTPVE
ncbi:MAG TPA: DUF2950 family protein [Bryobacteraceae bacterium]|jgi:hypothetical protein